MVSPSPSECPSNAAEVVESLAVPGAAQDLTASTQRYESSITTAEFPAPGHEMEGRSAMVEVDMSIDMRTIVQKVVTRELCVAIDDIDARVRTHLLRLSQTMPHMPVSSVSIRGSMNSMESMKSPVRNSHVSAENTGLPRKLKPLKSRLALQELKGREDGEKLLRSKTRTLRPSQVPSRNVSETEASECWAGVVEGGTTAGRTDACDADQFIRKSNKSKKSEVEFHNEMTTFSKFELNLPWYSRIIRSPKYDMVVAGLVTTNAILMGIQANWVAVHNSDQIPTAFRAFEIVFCICFAIELLVRFVEYRLSLFTLPCWRWNVLDVFLVALQVIEECLTLVTSVSNLPSLTAVRVLRVLRILRIMRFVRIMRLVGELRILVTAIATSLKALMWTLVLIAIVIYIFALTILQLISDHRHINVWPSLGRSQRISATSTSKDLEQLTEMFQTLPQAAKTLFGAFTGGWSWHEIADPLDREISTWLSLLMVAYIAFMVLALMNVVTGVFVDSAITKTKEQSDIFMINNVREIFDDIDMEMTWADFEGKLQQPEMTRYFQYLDVDYSDARSLFSLIDSDNSGTINAEEFLTSCLRLKGPTKSLDFQLLQRDFEELKYELKEFHGLFEKSLGIRHGRTVGSAGATSRTVAQGAELH